MKKETITILKTNTEKKIEELKNEAVIIAYCCCGAKRTTNTHKC